MRIPRVLSRSPSLRPVPLRLLLALLCLGPLAAPAGAQDEDEEPLGYVRDGWYVGIAGVNALENWQNTRGISVSDAMGLHAYVGYRFLEHWALEFEYERVFEFRLRTNPKIKADANVYTANLRALYPIGRFAPYALAGLGLHQVDVDDQGVPFGRFGGGETGGFTSRLGGGLDVYLTEHWVGTLSATYVLPWEKDNNSFQYLSLGWGLQYRFAPFEY